MPLATPTAVTKSYSVLPVPKDLIPSTGIKQANILWVGCSDSWITETSALDVLPEETFVHRNLGNVMSNGDLSSESAVVYCVDLLKASHVNHIVVCGHYDCGLVKASGEEPNAIHGWYKDLSELHALNDTLCSSLPAGARNRHLVEIYALAEANWLRSQPAVAKAVAERGLQIHAFVFDKEKETCVQIVEGGEKGCTKPAEKSENGEIVNAAAAVQGEGDVIGDVQALREIDLTTRANGKVNRSVNGNGNGKVNGARNLKEEKKCDGACGGKGLCKGTGEYAF